VIISNRIEIILFLCGTNPKSNSFSDFHHIIRPANLKDSQNINDEFTQEQQEVLSSIRVSRIFLPILIGIGVVAYLLWKQFDPAEFAKITWSGRTFFWVAMAVVILVIRHIAYATRLRVLSEKAFSWKKCVELIFIWEFSSAVSPTSVGGSAVAFFVLAQEKLSTAKTATIVLYTVVLDTIFFVGTLPILFAIFGTTMIRPDMNSLADLDKYGIGFFIAYALMATYGLFFFIGLFHKPNAIKRLLTSITKIGFLKRYNKGAIELGDGMIAASKELKKQKWPFHIKAFLATATAWSCRFLLLNCLIIGLMEGVPTDLYAQGELYARLETMFVVTSETLGTVIATIWRLLTYYSYLLIGAIIIPNWIRTVLNERKRSKTSA